MRPGQFPGRFEARNFGRFGDAPGGSPAGAGMAVAPGMVAVNAQTMQQRNAIPNDSERRFYFTYQTPNIASIAAAGSTSNTVQFDNDSVFVWVKTTVCADLAGAAQTNSTIVIPLVTVQIQDTTTGMYYSNAPIPLMNYAGWGELPYILAAPQMIQPVASLQFTWANYSAGTTYANLRLQLQGFKLRV